MAVSVVIIECADEPSGEAWPPVTMPGYPEDQHLDRAWQHSVMIQLLAVAVSAFCKSLVSYPTLLPASSTGRLS